MNTREAFPKPDKNKEIPSELESRLLEKIPLVEDWIDAELDKHKDKAKPVSELGFKNLGLFFQGDFLDKAKVVQVEKIIMPPVATKFGIEELRDYEDIKAAGITYKDTYFINDKNIESESLHFHELIHVVQWEHLASSKFLEEYSKNILENGYSESVFEKMAREHTSNFITYLDKEDKIDPYDVVQVVKDELDIMFPSIK